MSDDDDHDLDIIRSARKELNLSQYIEVLTHSQLQHQHAGSERNGQGIEVTALEDKGAIPICSLSQDRSAIVLDDDDHSDSGDGTREPLERVLESDWSSDDPAAAYRDYKSLKSRKRKRAAQEKSRIRAAKKSKLFSEANIVGHRPRLQQREGHHHLLGLSTDVFAEDGDNSLADTYLDDPIPDYILSRQKHLKKLHEAGLRYPPNFDDSDSDSEMEEKPKFHAAIKPQRGKNIIRLHESGGVIPASIAQWLRDYQVDGVRFLHARFVRQTGALLGDDMGLGKTIQIIAFLTAAFGKNGTKRDARRMRKVRNLAEKSWYPRILIICPGTLMQNWEDELSRWGWWEVYRYHGASAAHRKGVLGAAAKGRLEIMITTYTTYRNHQSEINTIDWDCVIADECHQIKSKNTEITKAMNKVNALCRIGLTGTAIQNKYEELWNLLNWARPGAYGSEQEWKQNISLPLKLGQAHDATNAQLADSRSRARELVHTILPGVFLRRMKTLIADQLPKKKDRVVFCQLTEAQADAYQTFLESDRCEFIRTAREDCDCGSNKSRGWCCRTTIPSDGERWTTYMFPCMITLQKLANHLALIVPMSTDNNDKQAKDLQTLELACPDTWQALFRTRDKIIDKKQTGFCGKWKVLRRLLEFWHANGDKVLIFSHSVRLLRLLRGLFTIDGTKFNVSYLDGSMGYEDRSKAVADFNADSKQFVFLISTKSGGVGLNITSANKVVVVDPNWNPAYDLQAQDRAYRIGQTRDVEVFRLVSSGTIEEIVYARQIYKQQQANIGYNASEERRYFKGVMDESTKKGELFGLQNLFTFQEDSVLLRDIMHKTNVAETKAGVHALDISFHDTHIDSEDDDDILSNKSFGIEEGDDTNEAEIKRLAEAFTSASFNGTGSTRGRRKVVKRKGPDPIHAILAKAGVQYTHDNSEVVGRSEIEARLGEQAMEVRNDIDLATKRVFPTSQSQSQSQPADYSFSPFSPFSPSPESRASSAGEDGEHDSRAAVSKREFRIHYKYRPDEQIRRRQFCSMAESMGFDDPVEFATLVENATQDERRKMLERFYRARRRDIWLEMGKWRRTGNSVK